MTVLTPVPPTVILIDGPSGSGKTDYAERLVAEWPGAVCPTLVLLDSVYPGWDGLEAASAHITEHLLRPFRAGGTPRWRRYDWACEQRAEWHVVDPAAPLVVEGCGALSRANAALADRTVWVETGDAERKRRALARDGDLYAGQWDRWDRQWREFVARERPRELAQLVVRT